MKKTITILVIFLQFGFQLLAQSLTEKEVIGHWSVVKTNRLIKDVPKEQEQQMELLEKAFLESKFLFEADYHFSFDFSYPEAQMEMKNSHWKIDNTSNSIVVQSWKDKDTDKKKLMEIKIKKENGKIYFLISESFFVLEVKKN